MVSKWHFISGAFEVSTGVLRGMGKSFLSMMLTIIFAIIFRIVWLFTVCVIIPNNITVLYLSYPISWIITMIGMIICIFLYYKSLTTKKDLQKFL
jgi:Na+-driven multidrug efflux pump